MSTFTATVALLVLLAGHGFARPSRIEASVVGTWGVQSISGEINRTYKADHTLTLTGGAGDPPLRGRWWVERDELVSYFRPPKEYTDSALVGLLRQHRREKIVSITMKELTLVSEGRKMVFVRMLCPRCRTRLGSFATAQTLPTRLKSCPKCGFQLEKL